MNKLLIYAFLLSTFLFLPKSWFSCTDTPKHIRAISPVFGRMRIFTGTKQIAFIDAKRDTVKYLREVVIGNRIEYYDINNHYFMTTCINGETPEFWQNVTYYKEP